MGRASKPPPPPTTGMSTNSHDSRDFLNRTSLYPGAFSAGLSSRYGANLSASHGGVTERVGRCRGQLCQLLFVVVWVNPCFANNVSINKQNDLPLSRCVSLPLKSSGARRDEVRGRTRTPKIT